MPELPTGTVTLMFTDVEGSTQLLHVLGTDAYAQAIAEHRRLLRAAFAARGGVEVDTQGDAFFVAFSDARQAVAAAVDAQVALGGGPIAVRIGLHTGSPSVSPDGYVGPDVHLASRVAAAGHGGQILLSQATRGLVGDAATDLGEHRLKDFAAPVRIYQVGSEIFPPLKTISNTNLPRPASSFIGREHEVGEITALLRDGVRLLTLTGAGGTGKTRLAIEAASAQVPDFEAGVFWIPLESVRDHALVTDTIARVIGAKHGLAEHIGSRHMLLLVDNLEQVIAAALELAVLVEKCPNLSVVTTSRELLRVRGEVEYAVPPLADREAVELFTTRSGVEPDGTVEELCRRLDNLPLAVELAAARARVLTPTQILERLSGRLDLLKGGRDADPRQQTLRAAIEWSYDLLDDGEKRLFSRFAVFSGGATLEAAERTVDGDVDGMQGLVDKSLLRHAGDRFWMLETIREFAADRLAAAGLDEDVRDRHANYFLELAERLEPGMFGPGSTEVNDAVERDHANYRAALDHFEAKGDLQKEMRLAGALGDFWDERAHQREALARYTHLLSAARQSATLSGAKILITAASMTMMTGDLAAAERLNAEGLKVYRDLGNARGIALSLWGAGYMLTEQGRFDEATEFLEEARTLFEKLGDNLRLMWLLRAIGHTRSESGDHDIARRIYAESLALARTSEDRPLQAQTTGSLARLAALAGDQVEAVTFVRESLGLVEDARDPTRVVERLVNAADVFAMMDRSDVATSLLAHADARHHEIGAEEPWVTRMKHRLVATLPERMGADAFDAAWAYGRRLSTRAALELAYATLDQIADGNAD